MNLTRICTCISIIFVVLTSFTGCGNKEPELLLVDVSDSVDSEEPELFPVDSSDSTDPEEPELCPASSSICQEKVDAMADLTGGLVLPAHFEQENPERRGDEFDVNEYFHIVEHLSMEPGYVLDYVYYFDMLGGEPMIYARPEERPPYANLSEYYAVVNTDEERKKHYFLNHINIEQTEDGYLEFVILHVMAGQFYLYWHANYDDYRIIGNQNGLEALLGTILLFDIWIPEDIASIARITYQCPRVDMSGDDVVVTVTIFTKWGGFLLRTYTISKVFPHEIKELEHETLADWNCGVMF